MNGQEALWSATEVKTQAAQCAGQVTIWDACEEALTAALNDICDVCGASPVTVTDTYHAGVQALCQEHS